MGVVFLQLWLIKQPDIILQITRAENYVPAHISVYN